MLTELVPVVRHEDDDGAVQLPSRGDRSDQLAEDVVDRQERPPFRKVVRAERLERRGVDRRQRAHVAGLAPHVVQFPRRRASAGGTRRTRARTAARGSHGQRAARSARSRGTTAADAGAVAHERVGGAARARRSRSPPARRRRTARRPGRPRRSRSTRSIRSRSPSRTTGPIPAARTARRRTGSCSGTCRRDRCGSRRRAATPAACSCRPGRAPPCCRGRRCACRSAR